VRLPTRFVPAKQHLLGAFGLLSPLRERGRSRRSSCSQGCSRGTAAMSAGVEFGGGVPNRAPDLQLVAGQAPHREWADSVRKRTPKSYPSTLPTEDPLPSHTQQSQGSIPKLAVSQSGRRQRSIPLPLQLSAIRWSGDSFVPAPQPITTRHDLSKITGD
jgi:hypothetical protein